MARWTWILEALRDPQGWSNTVKSVGVTTIVLVVLVGFLVGYRIGLWLGGE